MFLCICQCKISNLRRAAEAEGEPAAIAAVDVAVGIADLDDAAGVFKDGEERLAEEAELAAVGVAGQGQGDAIGGTIVDAFGVMGEQDGGNICGQILHGLLHIILALCFEMRPVHRVVDTEQIEILARYFAILIAEDIDARFGKVFADGIDAAEVLVIAEGKPDAIGKCIDVAFEDLGGFFVLCHIVEKVAGDGEHIGLLGGNAAQQCVELGYGKEAAEVDITDLRETIALPCPESLDGNRVGALDGRLALPEATVDAQASSYRGIDGGVAEQATAALVDGHGHHAAPEEADCDRDEYESRADKLCHEADNDGLDDEARPRYEMVDDGAPEEPSHADDVEQQHDDAGPSQRSAGEEIARREEQAGDDGDDHDDHDECEPGQRISS